MKAFTSLVSDLICSAFFRLWIKMRKWGSDLSTSWRWHLLLCHTHTHTRCSVTLTHTHTRGSECEPRIENHPASGKRSFIIYLQLICVAPITSTDCHQQHRQMRLIALPVSCVGVNFPCLSRLCQIVKKGWSEGKRFPPGQEQRLQISIRIIKRIQRKSPQNS